MGKWMRCRKRYKLYDGTDIKTFNNCTDAFAHLMKLKEQYGKHTPRCLRNDIATFQACELCIYAVKIHD